MPAEPLYILYDRYGALIAIAPMRTIRQWYALRPATEERIRDLEGRHTIYPGRQPIYIEHYPPPRDGQGMTDEHFAFGGRGPVSSSNDDDPPA